MPEDRDHRRLKTPPAGVRDQIAPESWDDDETPPPGPAPSSPEAAERGRLARINRRVKTTTRATLAVLDLTKVMHAELGDRIKAMDAEIAELRAAAARNEGQLSVLIDSLEESRRARRQIDEAAVASMRAGVEITRTRALSEIEVERSGAVAQIVDRTEQQRYRREIVLKILVGVAAVWGLVSTIALAQCGVR